MNEVLAYHHIAHAVNDELLFSSVEEGARLWRTVVAATPGLLALTLMPNHLHLVHPRDVRDRLARALGAYTRWRNFRRGRTGPLLRPLPPPTPRGDRRAVRRDVRYVHLNPCRGLRSLVPDPLAWPWSTHRDWVGLSLDAVVPRTAQPQRFHRYVSSDPHVEMEGTPLPVAEDRAPSPALVRSTVASLARVPEDSLVRRGPFRSLYLSVATALCDAPSAQVRSVVDVGRGAIIRPASVEVLRVVERAVHDPRMQSVNAGLPFRRYRRET